MEIIKTVGAYAGLVSVLGVAVLAMLCFSQARDLRRLREWAGGAPERDAEVREVSEIVAEERSAELKILAEREERRLERSGELDYGFWDRLGRTGRVLTIIAFVVILGAAAAFAGTQLLGGDDAGTSTGGNGKQAQSGGGGSNRPKPGSINVAVLNGTGGLETGIAAVYADILDKGGYRTGAVTDATTTFTESVVMYSKGNQAAANMVSKTVDIDQTGPVTGEVESMSEGADVTVVIGTDHSDPPTGG